MSIVLGTATAAVSPPSGATALAQSGKVEVSWQPGAGAASYQVLRGTSAATITTVVGTGITGTTFSDTTVTNNTTYYYRVRATGDTQLSNITSALPRAATCTTGNTIVKENCFPGTTAWKVTNREQAVNGGIEGFASATSVNPGGSLDLKINADTGAPYHVDIYRSGYYGGTQGRLMGSIRGLTAIQQPDCTNTFDAGLIDCGAWATSATVTTSASWPTGVYLAKLVREDNNTESQILFVVRHDGGHADVIYRLPDTTYQAYNNYGGRSSYDWNSSGDPTVSATSRAVKVSFNRPYKQVFTTQRDFYTFTDVEGVSWLEKQGYDVDYASTLDVENGQAVLSDHKVAVSGSHDEYVPQSVRNAMTTARNAGTSLAFLGANAVYWRVRFESSPVTGASNRTQAIYKTTQSGATDPVSPTGTWRDPAGANAPENALLGVQYIGDNEGAWFPLKVSAAEGQNRFWRHTGFSSLAPGTSDTIGQYLVGWEWDARVANGLEPAGLQTLSSTPVTGNLLTDAGRVYTQGAATSNSTEYKAASGAYVWATGTNHWTRGLGLNELGQGEPNSIVEQVTMNMLGDMGAAPTTPTSGLVVDPPGPPVITARTPAVNATGVSRTASVTVTLDRTLDPSTVDDTTLTLTGPGSTSVPGSVSYDEASRTVTMVPDAQLDTGTVYTAKLATTAKAWSGQGLAAAATWSFTSVAGPPPAVTAQTPAPGSSQISIGTNVTATFDRALNPATVTTGNVTLTPSGGAAVTATVSYNASSQQITLTPSALLAPNTLYTARVGTGVTATDGAALAAAVSWTFTTQPALSVSGQTPAPFASGIAPSAVVRGTFSRTMNAGTVTSANVTLTRAGNAVPATVTYDPNTLTVTLTPNATLLTSTTYTATIGTGVRAADGGALAAAVSWTFTTAAAPPPPPVATTLTPASGTTGVLLSSTVKASFDRALDPTSVTPQNITVTPAGGAAAAATVAYDNTTSTVTLTPSAPLLAGTVYTATIPAGGIRSSLGTPIASTVSWTFTTMDCPCQLMPSTLTPASTGNPVRDGRSGTGPWTYELGTSFTVDQAMKLTAVRYYKSPGETGTHVGRIWSSTGTQLASVTYTGETASGWQQQALASPITLTAGQTYVSSVGLNAFYSFTDLGLQTAKSNGPLRSIVGSNGLYANAAGTFPTLSYHQANYFADVVVTTPTGSTPAPQVVSTTPLGGATGVDPAAAVTATFDQAMDASTMTSANVTLTPSGGSAVTATVSYDPNTKTVTLQPSATLQNGTSYTARLSTGVKSSLGTALSAAYTWTFSTLTPAAPTVTATSPTAGSTGVSTGVAPTATFSVAMNAATITSSNVTLSGPGGAVAASVAYNSGTQSVTVTPSAQLAGGTAYTVQIGTGVRSAANVALAAPVSFGFTTAACPCSLYSPSATPALTGLDTKDGRSGTGPFTYELGTKIQVTSASQLTALEFYKSPGETGTHIGRVWNSAGTQLAQVTFTGETASGWQQQSLSVPVALTPGQTYVVSYGANAFFAMTQSGLGSQITNGPLQSVTSSVNGVFAASAGVFPTSSWSSSSYFVDAVVQ